MNSLIGLLNDVEEKNAPKEVYTAGKISLPLTDPRAAIVGSRKATIKGLEEADSIATFLAEQKIIVVSGLAEGIDTVAHTSAINAKGQTIAVLGTPLDKVYPQKNYELQKLITREHLAVSQFANGTPVQPKNFVLRNRTMALISDVTIIVEAGEKSGTIHQGWESFRLGRPLFIHKNVACESFSWIRDFVKYGALVFSDPEELLFELPRQPRYVDVISQ